jgi:hypothetical protein
MTINFTTLFTRIGKAINAADDLTASVDTEVLTDIRAFEDELDTESHDFRQAVIGTLEVSVDSALATIGSVLSTLVATPITNLIIETVYADNPSVAKTIDASLAELIEQMIDSGESVEESTIGYSIAYGEGVGSSSGTSGDNTGNGKFVFCDQRGDGRVNEFIFAETIRARCTSASTSGTATWSITCEPSKSLLDPTWPGGSGTTTSISTVTAASSNKITTGDMETESTIASDLPYGWVVETGTLGTTIKMTDVEQQTVTVNGTPTGGHYTLTFTDKYGRNHTTAPLAYNATASNVQTALRTLPFLDSVTVSSTGTSPNLTHSVTFTGVPNPTALTYTSNLTGGTPTITIATPTPGSPYVTRGARCLEIVGNSSELTSLLVPVSLSAKTCYAFNLWACVDVTPAAGVLKVDLIDGDSGDNVEDDQGTSNSFTTDLTALDASHTACNGFFHTPTTLPRAVYLRVSLTTALSTGTSLFLDELCLVAATRLYVGGPYLACFCGPLEFAQEDYVEVAVTNTRSGLLHEWLNRLLDLRSKDVLLPTATVSTQDDSLIA